jgi:orotate phosphoribosyltransferase
MTTGIEALVQKALELKKKGLTQPEIAQELNLSSNTIEWLLTQSPTTKERAPPDVKIGWRTIGVSGARIKMLADMMTDVILEELDAMEEECDAVVGIAINGIPIAAYASEALECDFVIHRPHVGGDVKVGLFSANYASVENKKVVVVDDVLGTGLTMQNAINTIKEAGGTPLLGVVIVNKTALDAVGGVPLRGLIRARAL